MWKLTWPSTPERAVTDGRASASEGEGEGEGGCAAPSAVPTSSHRHEEVEDGAEIIEDGAEIIEGGAEAFREGAEAVDAGAEAFKQGAYAPGGSLIQHRVTVEAMPARDERREVVCYRVEGSRWTDESLRQLSMCIARGEAGSALNQCVAAMKQRAH